MMNTGEPTERRPEKPVCLQCNCLDQLVHVPAAVRDGRSTGVVRASVVGRFGYDVPVEATVVQTSGLARMLAAPTRPRSGTGATIAFAVAALLGLWNLEVAVAGHGGSGAWAGFVFFLFVALAGGTLARARHRQARTLGPVVDGARWLWRRSWYCRRCGVVSVLTPNRSTVVGARPLAASLVDLSRRTRWQKRVTSPRSGAEAAR